MEVMVAMEVMVDTDMVDTEVDMVDMVDMVDTGRDLLMLKPDMDMVDMEVMDMVDVPMVVMVMVDFMVAMDMADTTKKFLSNSRVQCSNKFMLVQISFKN